MFRVDRQSVPAMAAYTFIFAGIGIHGPLVWGSGTLTTAPLSVALFMSINRSYHLQSEGIILAAACRDILRLN